jgi:aminocarboxymuconate-semialdehyde decarboxylase
MCVAVGGADNVLYGTDFPHNVGDMKGILALVRGLPGETATKVAGDNAKRIFGIAADFQPPQATVLSR